MALVGNLQDFSLLQLLNLINQGRKTGRLTVENGKSCALMFFLEGKLTFGYSADQVSVFREGLLQSGKITPEMDKYIFTAYRPVTEKGLALLLEESGILSRDEIVAQEASRLHELIDLVFSWETGTFKFEPGEAAPLQNVTVSLGLESILVEGSKRVQELEAINSFVPDLGAVARFSANQGEKARNVSLGTDEWRVVTAIDGKTTIKAIAEANGMDDFKIRKLMYGLVSAGMVDLEKPAQTGEPSHPARDQSLATVETASTRKGIILRLIDRINGI